MAKSGLLGTRVRLPFGTDFYAANMGASKHGCTGGTNFFSFSAGLCIYYNNWGPYGHACVLQTIHLVHSTCSGISKTLKVLILATMVLFRVLRHPPEAISQYFPLRLCLLTVIHGYLTSVV